MFIVLITSCSENSMTKNFGGTSTINLPSGRRFVNITWKNDADLWILTKEDTALKPTIYHFTEKSNYGLKSGDVIIIETK